MEQIVSGIAEQINSILPMAVPVIATLIGVPLALKLFKRVAK